MAGELASLVVQRLPLDEFDHVAERVNAVTREQVLAVAKRYADPAYVQITLIGDRSVIQPQLDAAGIGPVEARATVQGKLEGGI